ncbi:hypothetical protein BDV96DRAFT_599375 [Lophiotrema nucula]|uniref:Uncharacterized protein n=1 Tax=Lophiotrema nucula TaxID=690887 RepID=A0A6A5ZA67_9PLEO|nr:hypothetical protein BDV96DRAFT_599375 [Lophiotrema nucula]
MAENVSFADFVKDARDKKKKEALAQEILGQGRKTGAGAVQNTRNTTPKPSLLSRMSGVGKRSASAKPTVPVKPNIDGKWKHDLHTLNNPDGPPKKNLNRTASASQIDRNTRTFDKFRSVVQGSAQNGSNDRGPGFSIKGVAATGPYTVIASNFAPGTTATDIELVMVPHGRSLVNCRLISSTPTVMAEMIFERKEHADNVIDVFNNKKADGRLLYVYLKETPNAGIAHSRPSGVLQRSSYDDMDVEMDDGRGRSNGTYQDGRYGFRDVRDNNPPRGPRRRF